MDLDLSEEDQMMRAIAMSLGENVTMSASKDEEKKDEQEGEKKSTEEEEEKERDKQMPEDPLAKDTIDQFTETIMCGRFRVFAFNKHCWMSFAWSLVCQSVAQMLLFAPDG